MTKNVHFWLPITPDCCPVAYLVLREDERDVIG